MDSKSTAQPASENEPEYSWLQDIRQIQPGSSAILQNNHLAFYFIHYTAFFFLFVSLISCMVVIVSILMRATKEKLDFSDRFPLYLATTDFLWGLSHFADHLVLTINTIYPNKTTAILLSSSLWFFLGYELFNAYCVHLSNLSLLIKH